MKAKVVVVKEAAVRAVEVRVAEKMEEAKVATTVAVEMGVVVRVEATVEATVGAVTVGGATVEEAATALVPLARVAEAVWARAVEGD